MQERNAKGRQRERDETAKAVRRLTAERKRHEQVEQRLWRQVVRLKTAGQKRADELLELHSALKTSRLLQRQRADSCAASARAAGLARREALLEHQGREVASIFRRI